MPSAASPCVSHWPAYALLGERQFFPVNRGGSVTVTRPGLGDPAVPYWSPEFSIGNPPLPEILDHH